MNTTPLCVLIVTENQNDSVLATLVLRQEYAEVEVLLAQDALEFADRLAAGGFSVAMVDNDLRWADGVAVFEAIERRHRECAGLLLVRDPADIDPPDCIDVVVPKASRGFVDLPKALEWAQRLRRARFQEDVDVGAYERLVGELPVGVISTSTRCSAGYPIAMIFPTQGSGLPFVSRSPNGAAETSGMNRKAGEGPRSTCV